MTGPSLAGIERRIRRRVFLPPPRLNLPDWCDRYAVIPKQSGSAEPGRWRTDRAPYQREIMEAMSDPGVQEVVMMKSSRVGYTAMITNAIGSWMDQDPSNILVVQPDQFTSETWSRMYLGPMLAETPKLEGLVQEYGEGGARHGGNTMLRKEFPGGSLISVWASSANRLRFVTMRRVIFDEIDGYEIAKEGDPLELGEKRAETFGRRRKIIKGSSPTIKGQSKIERAFDRSDQRYYFVPCPDCGHQQRLVWNHVRWDEGKPETAKYACEGCGVLIPPTAKQEMLRRGGWVATRPGRPVRGYHVSALYSPWVTWAFMAEKWLDAQKDQQALRVFINTFLGETFEIRGEELGASGLLSRRGQHWPDAKLLPAGVAVLTAAVDVQKDRLEWQVEGWGDGEENWKVHYGVIPGDPTMAGPWNDLDESLRRTWPHTHGEPLGIRCAVVDAGDGNRLREVYAFTKPRYGRRIYAIKGLSKGDARGLVRPKPTIDDRTGTRFFVFSPNTAKDTVFARLNVVVPGPRYVHLPALAWCDQAWVDGLTAEAVHYVKGKRLYRKHRERNEPLDLSVMNLVALALCGIPSDRLGRIADQRATAPDALVEEPAVADHVSRPRRRNGWSATQW